MKKKMYPNIEAERARIGMSINELSEQLGVTRKTFYNWILKGKIPQSKLEKMSDIFKKPIDYLLDKKAI